MSRARRLTPSAPESTAPSQLARLLLAWFQEQFLIIIAGLLALVILALTWLLRRAGNTADEAYDAAQVTEAKVRDALRDIDLNLKPRDDGASDKS